MQFLHIAPTLDWYVISTSMLGIAFSTVTWHVLQNTQYHYTTHHFILWFIELR